MSTSTRWILLAVAAALAGCGPSPEMVKNLRRENAREKLELDGTREAVTSLEAYTSSLRSGAPAPGRYLMVTPADLQRWAPGFLPYEMRASEVLSGATGTVIVKQVADLRLLARNRMSLRIFFQGQNVGYSKKVPSAYAKDVKRVKEAIASGVWADLEVNLIWNKEHSTVLAQATCTNVTLTRHNESMYRSELKKYLNQRMLDRPFNAKVPALEGRTADSMFATANHLVFVYR